MKNYELMSRLSELPAGCEIVFDSVLPYEKISGMDKEAAHVISEIHEAEKIENIILLS